MVDLKAGPGSSLSLSVRDNGRGFDVNSVLAMSAGVGMSSMRMRIERMGGQLRIESRPGETRLTATIYGAQPAPDGAASNPLQAT